MLTRTVGKVDHLERMSRAVTLIFFALAAIACVGAPLLAIAVSNRPFPGFVVEPTLVVTTSQGQDWSGAQAGIQAPQHVLRIAGGSVDNAADFDAVLSAHAVGQTISVFTNLPDGSTRLYPSILLIRFPPADLARLFLLPYALGLAYLAIAIWIYRIRGRDRPGRALSFFCICTSLTLMLLFDLATTHVSSELWTLAIAMAGGALITLGMRFPREWRPVRRRPWLLGLPYVVSVLLAGWGWLALQDRTNPWAYQAAWQASYRYIALAMILFLWMTLNRAVRSRSPVVQRQARVVLLGSTLAFAPLGIWFVLPMFNVSPPFNGILLLPELLLFPLSVGAAILRYGLLEIDIIINRTIVYGAATAILAGLFTIAITISQKVFVALTGANSDAAVIVATLIVASAFTPLKAYLQSLVDRRFKQVPDNTEELRGFGAQVRASVQLRDARQLAGRLLEEAALGLQAGSGAITLTTPAGTQTIQTYGNWRGEAWIMIPLESEGERFGLLSLGPRQSRQPYTPAEYQALEAVVAEVSAGLRLAMPPEATGQLARGAQNDRGPVTRRAA